MNVQKFRWSRVYESSEEELTALLQARNIKATRIAAEASSEQPQPATKRDTTIWCAEGSLVVHTSSTSTSLQPGDAVRIGADTGYDLNAGISGYVCYVSS
ncbi:MAG: hypothetical protein JWN82_608 [Candidatus Saccharibacteria bacterium]|nr:hypothetical protein [Candidatus Saccharibacteria bacterium]